jgi:hypothetical protein
VVSVDDGKIIFDKGKIVRNGAALHLDPGIAVTSHASQSKTVDQVIASVPVRSFSQSNEAQFYVTMSHARWAMHVFTDAVAYFFWRERAKCLRPADTADKRSVKGEPE